MTRRLFALILITGLVLGGCAPAVPATTPARVDAATWDKFETKLEYLRQQMKIPGMSAAIVMDQKLVWAKGLGYADLENQVPATADTPYELASVTKPSAAVAIMQLVEDGKLSLDDPVSRYGVNLPEGDKVLVRHLLSHTSAGTPGARYQYDGSRYSLLSQVVLAATGRSLQDWLYERILSPLGMDNTAPGPPATCAGLSFAPACERVYASLARPYMLDADLNPVPGLYKDTYSAAAGLISTVVDLAKFDAALDTNTLLTAATEEQMWTPTVSNSGQKLPYGLGWFTQDYRGTRLIWHTGFSPPSTSALFVKLPDEGLTFIALANTDLLSRNFQAGHGDASDVLSSLAAVTFYKHFVVAPRYGKTLPEMDWAAGESAVLMKISRMENEAVRDILSREFQARRNLASALADVKDQAERVAAMQTTAKILAASQDPQVLDQYVGTYQFPDAGGLVLTASRVENRLYASQAGAPAQELLPLSATRFFVPAGYDVYQLEFVPGASDQNWRLVLALYGMTYTGWRE